MTHYALIDGEHPAPALPDGAVPLTFFNPEHPYSLLGTHCDARGKYLLGIRPLNSEERHLDDLAAAILDSVRTMSQLFAKSDPRMESHDFTQFSREVFFTGMAKVMFGLDLGHIAKSATRALAFIEE